MAALVAYTPTPVHEHPRVFNHDIMHCTADGVVGNHLYSGRVLGMTSPEDVIQLHPDLKPEWKHIQEHYYRINLPHTKQVIWDLDYEYMRGHPDHVTSVFFFDDTIGGARPDDAWARTVAYINSKNDFMALAKELKLDVPRTLCFESVGKITILDDVAFPCYLKAAISVSGVGIFRCETPADLRKAMSYFDNATPVQIQEEVRTDLFLNMQYRVTEKGLERFAATEQVLDGFTHMGNRYPARHEPWESVESMAIWLWKRGIKDVFAFDVGVVATDRGTRYIPIECNPRFNGATYPTGIAEEFEIPGWTAVQLNTRWRSLADLDLSGIEFNPRIKKGIILVNWGPILAGKIGVLIAGNPTEQDILRIELERRL